MSELVERFKNASTTVERNRLVAIADARDPDGKQALIDAILDPTTKGSRGSLVYALLIGEYPCHDQLAILIGCVCIGSFEEACHAMQILRGLDILLPESVSAELQRQLTTAQGEPVAAWRREAIQDCIDMF